MHEVTEGLHEVDHEQKKESSAAILPRWHVRELSIYRASERQVRGNAVTVGVQLHGAMPSCALT